jgi:hypothetical protein
MVTKQDEAVWGCIGGLLMIVGAFLASGLGGMMFASGLWLILGLIWEAQRGA